MRTGEVAGLAVALARLLRSLLYGVQPGDPAVFAAVLVTIGGGAAGELAAGAESGGRGSDGGAAGELKPAGRGAVGTPFDGRRSMGTPLG